jgi:hypothetical protein
MVKERDWSLSNFGYNFRLKKLQESFMEVLSLKRMQLTSSNNKILMDS